MTPREAVAAVLDPELPSLTIEDLGILRDVVEVGDRVVVTITPTYTGCPALQEISDDIRAALPGRDVEVRTVLAPAWTSDWISAAGREKLAAGGIAPPRRGVVPVTLTVRCPQCGSGDTEQLSRFGSTACKELWRCSACREPFDHFRDH